MSTMLSLTCGATVAHLLQQTLRAYPPAYPNQQLPPGAGPHQLGQYVCTLGYMTPTQLDAALAEQQQAAVHGHPILLGDLLVRTYRLPPRVLSTLLMIQLIDRLLAPTWAPQLLGEFLIVQQIIRPADLIDVLKLQIWSRLAGQQISLGDLLKRQGLIDDVQLAHARMLQHQHTRLRCADAVFDQAALMRNDTFDVPDCLT